MTRTLPPRPARRSALSMLLTIVVLAARLLGPALPMPLDAASALNDVPICHGGPGEERPDPVPGGPGGHLHDCLACAICHLASHAALPTTDAVLAHKGGIAATTRLAMPSLATGPPYGIGLATPPTGPPILPI